MSMSDGVFNNLRQKLDVFGYKQALPLAAIPLVGALFEDLVKTTESLRDSKRKVAQLLEEKNCWELGVEPYKCDNSRLLSECNQLHLLTLKQQEDFEKRECEYNQKIRDLQSDKFHLEEQCTQLQDQIQKLVAKQTGNLGMNKDASVKGKKPFISTVRSGHELPPLQPLSEHTLSASCSKCNAAGCTQRAHASHDSKNHSCHAKEIAQLEKNVKNLSEQLAFFKRKVESRDREIGRLNELLSGGRSPAALAKDCCYKQVGALAEDINLLQREKSENFNKIQNFQDQMHEAMQRALKLEATNRQLRIELDEFKKAALQIEQQANTDAAKRERELEKLKQEIKRLSDLNRRSKIQKDPNPEKQKENEAEQMKSAAEKQRLKEQLNTLIQREIELKASNQMLHKQVHKLKRKQTSLRKELKDSAEQYRTASLDEEKIRLKSERDFFQKEYLRLVSKSGSDKEIEFLQEQVKSKDEELRILRSELCLRDDLCLPTTPGTDCTPHQQPQHPLTSNSNVTTTSCQSQINGNHKVPIEATCTNSCGDINRTATSMGMAHCVQAVVLRAERERDMARAELDRVRCERDTLREKHVSLLQAQAEEAEKVQQRCNELNARIRELERENREMNSARLPSETQIVILKEEIDDLRGRLFAVQEENCMLKTKHSQLKLVHDQTERSLLEYQNKLTFAEHQLESADLRLNTLDSNRETVRTEATQLRSEINALKQAYIALEREKDVLLNQLDTKTQRACELELELKVCREKRDIFEMRTNELEEKLSKVSREKNEKSKEAYETSSELKLLRHQIEALKKSRDDAIAENGTLVDSCSDVKAENYQLKKEIDDHIKENDALKKKICQYVQEIRKTEELLLRKEREREEMLEQYRSLSQDTVALQGNNHSLEEEAAEYKRQVADFEKEICSLKTEIKCRTGIIDEMEAKMTALTERNLSLHHRLEEVQDEKHLLKLDLTSRTELCTRLEDERTKLNAEIEELNNALRAAQAEKDNEKPHTTRVEEDTVNSLEITLQNTRLDLENQLRLDKQLNEELLRLRRQNETLMEDLEAAHLKNMQCEKLIHEYFVQNQELRHTLTDDRFRRARAREQQQKHTSSSLKIFKDSEKTTNVTLHSPTLSPRNQCKIRSDFMLSSAQTNIRSNAVRESSGLSEEASSSIESPFRRVTVESDTKDKGSCCNNTRKRNITKETMFPYYSKTM